MVVEMTIDELITKVLQVVNTQKGSFYTSTKMRDNPDVCHAACLWFQHNLATSNALNALTLLDNTDKATLKAAQAEAIKGTTIPGEMVRAARASGKVITDEDIAALTYVLGHWTQPTNYSDRTPDVVNAIITAMRTNSDKLLIYMTPAKGGTGHVICITRNVGGVMIYDPNMGVISAPLNQPDFWGSVLTMILQWYSREMQLTQVGFR